VPEARRLDEISYEEMQVLADAGAKVLNAEAVEWARREHIEIRCVATAGDAGVGTPVRAAASVTHPRVVSVTAHPGLFVLEPESPGTPPPTDLESTLAAHGAAESEVWILTSGWGALVPKQNVHGLPAFREAVANLGNVRLREDLTVVTVAGRALAAPPGLARAAATSLVGAGIPLRGHMVDAGRAAFLVDADRANEAVRVLHARLVDGEAVR
jgi:aspartate kinase